MILGKEQVLEVLPQKDPFVMVDSLLKASEEHLASEFKIEPDNLLCEEGLFSVAGLIENIAQTCAAGFGYLSQQSGQILNGGFIGSVNKLTTHQKPPVGSIINTKVEVLAKFENIILVKGANHHKGAVLLECEMKIVTL